MVDGAFKTLLLVTFISGMTTALIKCSDRPIVQRSWATKECIKVIPQGSCAALPSTYKTEWVK